MKKNYKLFVTLLLFFSVIFSAYSQKTKTVSIYKFKQYVFDESEGKQTKSGLTIEVEPLSVSGLYKHPELYSFTSDAMPQEFRTYLTTSFNQYDNKYWSYPLGSGDYNLTAMLIKITNNTGHILKMSDARILLRIEGEDPIKPVTKMGNSTMASKTLADGKTVSLPMSAISEDNSLMHWVTAMEIKFDATRKKGFISFQYPYGLNAQVIALHKKNYKLIADVDAEILPDDSYSGVLLFPVMVSYSNLNLKLYEFVTKTDPAGNPSERTNFDFKLKLEDQTLWWEYNKNKWEVGSPPSPVYYYDKASKTYVYGAPKKD